MQRARCAPSVEGNDRDEVEEVQEEAHEREPHQHVRPGGFGRDPADRRASRAEQRAGERNLGLLPGVVGKLLHPDDRAEERDEQRRARPDALPPELEDVAELVHQDEEHESDREGQPPEPRVRRDRDEHRPRGEQDLELEQQPAELQQEAAEDDEGRRQLAQQLSQPGLAADGLVVARIGCRHGLVPRIRLVLYDPWPIHSSPPT
jgi:hypothetical protein